MKLGSCFVESVLRIEGTVSETLIVTGRSVSSAHPFG
jgi:hypothetical protein